jgi:hypothetical protein
MLVLLSVVVLGSLVMCSRGQNASGKRSSGATGVGVTNAQATESSSAAALEPDVVEQLAQTWCAQERSCNRVGAGYLALFDCLARTRSSVHDDLSALTCSHGIDWSRAPACAAEIEQVGCQDPLVTLLSLEKCRSDTLCAR